MCTDAKFMVYILVVYLLYFGWGSSGSQYFTKDVQRNVFTLRITFHA